MAFPALAAVFLSLGKLRVTRPLGITPAQLRLDGFTLFTSRHPTKLAEQIGGRLEFE